MVWLSASDGWCFFIQLLFFSGGDSRQTIWKWTTQTGFVPQTAHRLATLIPWSAPHKFAGHTCVFQMFVFRKKAGRQAVSYLFPILLGQSLCDSALPSSIFPLFWLIYRLIKTDERTLTMLVSNYTVSCLTDNLTIFEPRKRHMFK